MVSVSTRLNEPPPKAPGSTEVVQENKYISVLTKYVLWIVYLCRQPPFFFDSEQTKVGMFFISGFRLYLPVCHILCSYLLHESVCLTCLSSPHLSNLSCSEPHLHSGCRGNSTPKAALFLMAARLCYLNLCVCVSVCISGRYGSQTILLPGLMQSGCA